MPKRLLILCDAFVPPMYGTRMRNLIRNLSDEWQVDVACEQVREHEYSIPTATFHLFTYYPEKKGIGRIVWYFQWLRDKLLHRKEKQFLHFLRQEFRNTKFDLILASAYTFPLYSAREFSRLTETPLVLDLRDVFEQMGTSHYFTSPMPRLTKLTQVIEAVSGSRFQVSGSKFQVFSNHYAEYVLRERNKALEQAAAVTTVSTWHKELLSRYNTNTYLVYNGYDEQTFAPKDIRAEHFSITYTGRMYEQSLRDPALLFQALSHMPTLPSLSVDWYTDEAGKAAVSAMAEQYGVGHLMRYHDYVAPDKVCDVLHKSSIILVLTNKATADGPHGIMTTKFFEALGSEKPVLCVRSDEECLAQVIKDTNAGLAATTAEQVEQFISDKYAEWKEKGFTHQQVNQEQKSLFSRQKQAEQFAEIFRNTICHSQARYTLTDICWTLFSSNTTFDFLDFLFSSNASYRRLRRLFKTRAGKYANLLLYRLFRYDMHRRLAARHLKGMTRTELEQKAEQFYQSYLLPRKIENVWRVLPKENIVIASGTLDVIANTVAKHIGAYKVYASRLQYKNDVCTGTLSDILLTKHLHIAGIEHFDIITDNLTDAELVNKAEKATIVTYNNLSRWKKRVGNNPSTEITYIEAETDRY